MISEKIFLILAQVPNDLTGLPEVSANPNQLRDILAVVFGVVGALAILTIMIAAFNFATAQSDADKISRSKKAIIFALIGLAIAIGAEAIVLTTIGEVAG